MYKWTFEEKKKTYGDGWTIVIPDGFVQIKSFDEGRLFEIIPDAYSDGKYDANDIPVSIIPGEAGDFSENEFEWSFHPLANEGKLGILAAGIGESLFKVLGKAPEVMSTVWSDVGAFILINDTLNSSYSYQITIVVSNKKTFQFRVQTQSILPEQKEDLTASIINWLHLMTFDKKNEFFPQYVKVDDPSIFDITTETIQKSKLEEAINQINNDYTMAIYGQISMIMLMVKSGLRSVEETKNVIRNALVNGIVLKEFYLEKVNLLTKKIIDNCKDNNTLSSFFSVLHGLDNDTTEVNLDGEKIEIEVTKRILEIRKEWSDIEKYLGEKEKDYSEVSDYSCIDSEVQKKEVRDKEQEYIIKIKGYYNDLSNIKKLMIDEQEKVIDLLLSCKNHYEQEEINNHMKEYYSSCHLKCNKIIEELSELQTVLISENIKMEIIDYEIKIWKMAISFMEIIKMGLD